MLAPMNPRRDRFSKSHLRICVITLAVSVLTSLPAIRTDGQDPMTLPRIMEQDPQFVELKPEVVFSRRLVPVWVDALRAKNVHVQRQAAESLAIASLRGLGPLDPSHDTLLEMISQPELHRKVRVACAKAIVAMDLKAAEPDFVGLMKSAVDDELQYIIQPALAKWQSDAAREHWLELLQASRDSDQTIAISRRVLAVHGLASLGEKSIVEELAGIVTNPSAPFRYRNPCAAALGELTQTGQEKLASDLAGSKLISNRILAAKILARHESDQAVEWRLKLAKDEEPAIATIAWSDLLKSSQAAKLDPLADFGIGNRGPEVRQLAIQLAQRWKNEDSVVKIASLLPDLHPDVRVLARKTLLKLARQPALKMPVINEAISKLDSNWQGIQQALLILTELDHKPAAMKMIELLDHLRPEVHVTAGWSLERLSVKETFDPLFKRVESQIESGEYQRHSDSESESTSHLIQLLGRNKYQALEDKVIPKLIPKDMLVNHLPIRPAAIWSIGQIYAGQELPPKYIELLSARLLDDNPMNPESKNVKSMCAYTFAMSNAQSMIPNIEKYAEAVSPNSMFGFFCNWSLKQLDGREMPIVQRFQRNDTNWFLVPID